MFMTHDKSGYYYIINGYGDIVASGKNSLECYKAYCKKYGAPMGGEIQHDTKLYYDSEHDTYYTETMLYDSWCNDGIDQESYDYNYHNYIAECTGKNGILEEV